MYTLANSHLNRLLQHFAQTEQFAFFDTAKPGQANSDSYLFERPLIRLRCGIGDDGISFLYEVQSWLDKGYHVAGWFGYEFGELLAGMRPGLTNIPEGTGAVTADLGVFPAPTVFDHQSGNCTFPLAGEFVETSYSISDLRPNVTEEEYLRAIDAVLEYIRAGDTYQVNYTLKLLFGFSGSVEGLYRDLRRNQSVAYGSYIRWGEERVLSFSPELFFRKSRSGLQVCPMKGTLQRGRDLEEDAQACAYLHNDPKNRSENVMIVDLLRNDLGRVLHEVGGGDVRVTSLFDVEVYESLLQMTSTIEGIASPERIRDMSLQTLFEGLFPCGSVTGAPKIRTMEIIRELEKEERGVYTGAIGFLAPDGSGVFNVPIRTLQLRGGTGEMGIGSGITHDSDPRGEWQECLLKGRFLTDPIPQFTLFETMLWSDEEGFWLFNEHLARLRASAEYFNFCCSKELILQRLRQHLENCSGTRRVRLTLGKDGTVEVVSSAVEPPRYRDFPEARAAAEAGMPSVRFATVVTDSELVWFRHKTSRRTVYDEEFARAREENLYDLLFINERGHVTEGAITNVVIRSDGAYYTPPLECGLLPGTLRQWLLNHSACELREKQLTPQEVLAADELFMLNSVRGVTRVSIAG